MTPQEHLAAVLRGIRGTQTLRAFADRTGLSAATLSRIDRGASLDLDTFLDLSRALDWNKPRRRRRTKPTTAAATVADDLAAPSAREAVAASVAPSRAARRASALGPPPVAGPSRRKS